MELQQLWKKLEQDKLEVVKATALAEWPPRSKHPVRKLEQGFLLALLFVVFFEGAFLYLFLQFEHPLVRSFLLLVILGYVFFFVVNYRVYRHIRKRLDFSDNLYHTLTHIYQKVDTSLRFQRKAAIFIYPIAASAGFLMGFATEKDPSQIIEEPKQLLIMVVVSALLTPLGYWLARVMEKHSYGKYCTQLKELINQMEPGKNDEK
ncbi:MAG: hypothetical protein ACOYXA_15605 [Bacteroidota bacterium]